MFDEETIKKIDFVLGRIFSLPITRSTFRELQNTAIGIANGDTKKAKTLLDCLLSGSKLEGLQLVVEKYSIQTRVAKDVFERGEFINLVSSDMMTQGERMVFLHRLKRVDGKELEFITDLESNLRLLRHFATRLQEAKQKESGKIAIEKLKTEIENIKKMLSDI